VRTGEKGQTTSPGRVTTHWGKKELHILESGKITINRGKGEARLYSRRRVAVVGIVVKKKFQLGRGWWAPTNQKKERRSKRIPGGEGGPRLSFMKKREKGAWSVAAGGGKVGRGKGS